MSHAPAPERRPLVLVVEDDARSASVLARMLRVDGYDAEVTIDGAAALARLSRQPIPDVLVTDFHMAHADGLAVARYARSRRPSIVVFVLTIHPHSPEAAAEPLEPPIHILTKPLDYALLVHSLRDALGSVSVA